ncbi:hypothetical protein BC831DRAFT_469710 [Entophlyctis helioformis]|nr:hypothetical protein BC831DRAFT_469710 [Entophlyctis helioformis]
MSQLSLVSATDPNSPFSSSLMSSLPQPLSFGPGTLSLMDMPNGPSSSGIPTPSHHMPVSTPVTASPASAVSASAHDPFNYANSYFASTLPPLGSFSTGTEAGAHSIGAFNHRSIPGLMTMGPNGKRRYSSLPGLNTLKAPTMSPFPYPHATHYEHFEPLLEHHSQQSHQQQQMQQQHQAQAQAHMQMQMQQGAPMGGQLSSSATHGDGKVGKTRPRSKSHNSHSSRPNALIDALNIPAPLVELTSPFDHDYSPMPASAPDHSQSADRFVSDDAAAMAGHGFAKKPMPVFSSAGDNVFLMTPPAMHDMPHFGLLPHSVIPHPQSHHMMYTPHSLQLSQTHSNQQVSIQQLQQIQVQQMNHNQQQQQQQQHMVQAHHMQLPPHLQQASSEQLMAADHHMAMAQSMEKEQQMHMQIQMQQHQQAQAQSAQQAAEPKPKTSPKPRQRRKSSVSKPMLSSIAPASSAGVMAGNPFPPMQVPSLTDTELSSSSLSAAVEIPPCPAGETSWKCSCGQVFEDWPLFYVHNNTHKAEEKTHICEHCNRGFTRRQDLKRHKLTHFQLFKPFECKNCGTTFTRNDALHRHIKARRCG